MSVVMRLLTGHGQLEELLLVRKKNVGIEKLQNVLFCIK